MLPVDLPMAKPVYIICSRLGAEDKLTGLISLYQVLEQVTLSKPIEGQPIVPFTFRITSVWMREDKDDPEQEFQFRILLRMPPGGKEIEVVQGTFRFSHLFRRFVFDTVLQEFESPGLMYVDCSVRQIDGADWITQSFPILLTLQSSGADASPATPRNSHTDDGSSPTQR